MEVVHHVRALLDSVQGALSGELRAWIEGLVGDGELRVVICIAIGGLFLVCILSYAVFRLYQVCKLDILLKL